MKFRVRMKQEKLGIRSTKPGILLDIIYNKVLVINDTYQVDKIKENYCILDRS